MDTGSRQKLVHDGLGHVGIRVDVQDARTFFSCSSISSVGQEKKHKKITILDHRTISVDQPPKHSLLPFEPGFIHGSHV